MNILFQAQIIAKMEMTEKVFQDNIAPVLLILDDLSGICGHTAHKPTFYRPGVLIDAPDTWAARWNSVIHIGASRHQALLSLMKSLEPLLENQLPFCSFQWKIESLDFLAS